MKLVRNPGSSGVALAEGSVVTIGAFDGVHVGHRKILERVVTRARDKGLSAVVFSFEPMPKEFFDSGEPRVARLTRFREKYEQLDELGLDLFFCPRFGSGIERLDATSFVDEVLVGTLACRHVVIGDDFRFARKRSGDLDDLRRDGARHGFGVEQIDSVMAADVRVSSTAVREALASGELERARAMLGRYYSMSGRVVRGAGLGRKLGFPTANVNLSRRLSPVYGIFAVRVAGIGDELMDGVASVGTRPTVDGTRPLLEVFVFDFAGDLYGQHIRVDFISRLRDEVKFPDLESLRVQMAIDADNARTILADLDAGPNASAQESDDSCE